MNDIDPISRDVFQTQLHGVADEMSTALRQAAFSSIIWDMYDYSCALFAPDGDMLAQADTIPAQLGCIQVDDELRKPQGRCLRRLGYPAAVKPRTSMAQNKGNLDKF